MIIQGVTLKGITVADAYIVNQNLAIRIDANNSSSYTGSGTTITDLSGMDILNFKPQSIG